MRGGGEGSDHGPLREERLRRRHGAAGADLRRHQQVGGTAPERAVHQRASSDRPAAAQTAAVSLTHTGGVSVKLRHSENNYSTLRAFSRHFHPKRLTKSKCQKKETIICCGYSKDVRRTKCQALTITRLLHFLYTTKIELCVVLYPKYYFKVQGCTTYHTQVRIYASCVTWSEQIQRWM